MKKKSLEEVQKDIDKVQKNRIKVIGDFKNTYTNVLVKCMDCGLEWMTTTKLLVRKEVGVNCKHHINLTPEMAIKRIHNQTNGNIEMIGKFKGAREKALMKCSICDYEWNTEPYSVYSGHGCPKCTGNARITTESFKKYVKEQCGSEYSVLSEVTKSHEPVIMKHNSDDCGNVYKTDPHHFMQGSRCPLEGYKRNAKIRSLPLEVAQKRLNDSWNGEFKIISGYKKVSAKCLIKHIGGCGKEFIASPQPLISHRNGCPRCYHSYGEEATKNYLLQNNYDFKEQLRIDECRNIRALPFDFAIFKDDKILFLIEYQGVQHHVPKFGAKNLKETQLRDKIKYEYCLNNNIPLIRIPYKRWYNFNDLQKQVNEYLDNEISMLIPNQAI